MPLQGSVVSFLNTTARFGPTTIIWVIINSPPFCAYTSFTSMGDEVCISAF